MQVPADGAGALFNMLEAAAEFLVRSPQALSESTLYQRIRLTTANNRSPSSFSVSSAVSACRTSSSSSITLSHTGSMVGQSNPTRAARSCNSCAWVNDGSPIGTPSNNPFSGVPLSARSFCLSFSQFRRTFCTPETSVSPNTCGWRRMSLL